MAGRVDFAPPAQPWADLRDAAVFYCDVGVLRGRACAVDDQTAAHHKIVHVVAPSGACWQNRNVPITCLRPVAVSPYGDITRAVPRFAPALDRARPINLALVANGKPNSGELLDLLAERLGGRVPIAEVRRYRKPSVSVAPTDADQSEIAEWAHAVLTAVGD